MSNPQDIIDDFEKSIKMSKSEWKTKKEKGKERIHYIRRPRPDDFQIKQAVEKIKNSKKPIIISGGGVFYSDAMDELGNFADKHNIPVTQKVMGY